MKRQFLLIITMLSCLWAGCSDDNKGVDKTSNKIYLSAVIADHMTKAEVTKFKAGSVVGIYVVDYTATGTPGVLTEAANRATNVKHWQSAAGLSSDVPVLWGDAKQVDIYGYYPYAKTPITDVSKLPFSVCANQTNKDSLDKSDFRWTKKAATPQPDAVKLSFSHVLSKMVINLKSDASVPGALVDARVRILGVDTAAVINLMDGSVKSGGSPSLNNVSMLGYEVAEEGYEMSYGAVLVPQTASVGKHLLEITTAAGHVYNYNLTESITFPAGYMLPLNITLKSGELLVEIGEITDWDVNESVVVGDAEIAKPYAIGDFYNEGGVQGVVFELDATGEHGKIVSPDEGSDTNAWATENVITGATSKTDGMSNTNILKTLDATLAKYPACKWCDGKNTNGVTGWYMPASGELQSLNKAFNAFGTAAFNEKIMATGVAGAAALNAFKSYNSSTENNKTGAFYVDFMDGRETSWIKMYDNGLRIRAVYAF